MRELKFKIYNGENISISRNIIDWLDAYAQFEYDTKSNQHQTVSKWKWLQCIGLKDKNGIEIYEGDIININQDFTGKIYEGLNTFVVVYYQGNYVIRKSLDEVFKNNTWRVGNFYPHDIEILGNIYENPELIK